ncbi:hypothetical protein PF008_g13630 [Phytophthora fragariae]|nr:hypothetical protein PF008_g13630 [Phytophthora fragariae]
MRIQMKSKRAVVMIHNRLWIESKGSSTLTVLRETIQNLRAEAISWSHLKSEVERCLEIYKTRQGDAVDLSNVFTRAWNNLKSRTGDISLQRQSNYFCGTRLHHWNFVVGKVEIGSGSHEEKREAFRLAAVSAAEFLLRLDDGQNERRWRPNCNESDSSESSDDCEFMFVRSTGSGPIAADALINLSDSSSENAIETEPSPSTSTPPREDSVDAENIEMFSQDQSVTAATSFDRDSDGEAMSSAGAQSCNLVSASAVTSDESPPVMARVTMAPATRSCRLCEIIRMRKPDSAGCRQCQMAKDYQGRS